MEDNFAHIKRTHVWQDSIPSDWPSRDDINKLVWKSSGQFIYAATVVRFVSPDYNSHGPVDRLQSIFNETLICETDISTLPDLPFAGLDALYAQILQIVSDRFPVCSQKTVPRLVILVGRELLFMKELHDCPADAFSKVLGVKAR